MSAAENLKRWKDSPRPRAWVEAHNGEWNHADWLALAEELKRSEYWPLELADVGGVLEELKSQWHDHQMQVEVLIEEAEAALEEGDLDLAVADCTEALKLGPNRNKTAWLVRALLTRARAYLGNKDHDRAAADAGEAARLDPGNREALTVREEARQAQAGPREAGRADAGNPGKAAPPATTISLPIDLACDGIISSRADALNVLHKACGLPLSDVATPEEVQRAYGLAATKYFPANNPGDDKAERRFRHVEAAWAFLQAEKVIAESSETLRANPRSPLAFYQRAEAHFRTGDLDRAIADCTEALRLDRTLFCAYGVRGTAWKRKGQHDKALADLNEALTWNPAYALAFQSRGDTYRLLGRYDQAVADCDQAIRLDPRFSWAFATRGAALRERKEYDRALADLNEALRLNPIYGWAYAERGEVHRRKGDTVRAVADCTEAIRLDKAVVGGFVYRASVYWDQGEDESALRDADETIRLEPTCARAFFIRGQVCLRRKEYDPAITAFTTAIRLDPANGNSYGNRGQAYRQKGDLDRAIADFDEAIRLDPTSAHAYLVRGYIFLSKGVNDRAVADLSEAIRLEPAKSAAYYHRGTAYQNKGDFDQAINDYTEAIRLDPTNSWAFSRRCELHRAKGELDKALADITETIRLDPGEASFHTAKKEIEERMKLRASASDVGTEAETNETQAPRRRLPTHSVDQRPDCKDSDYTMTGPDSARCHTCGLTWKLLPSGKLAPADPKRCEFCGTVMTVEDFQIQDSPDLGWASVGVACKNCGADWHWARAGHWQTQSLPRRERAEDAADIAAAGSGAEPQAQEQQPPAQQPQRYTRECLCVHCFAVWKFRHPIPIGTEVECNKCLETFQANEYVGNQDSLWDVVPFSEVLGGLASMLAGKKCPVCKRRGKVVYLGTRDLGQRYASGTPTNVVNLWVKYYKCRACNRTFNRGDGAPA